MVFRMGKKPAGEAKSEPVAKRSLPAFNGAHKKHDDTYFRFSADFMRDLLGHAFEAKTETEVTDSILPIIEDQIGGLDELAKGVGSSLQLGLSGDADDRERRGKAFGENRLPEEPPPTFLMLMWIALRDPTMMVLMGAAIVSLTLGMTNPHEDKSIAWLEGFGILVSVAVVTIVGAANSYSKNKQFRQLNAVKEDANINVFRQGRPAITSVFDICVGDLVKLEVGDVICADGIYCHGHSLRVNEASMTGESNDRAKGPYTFDDNRLITQSPFLFSATQVMEGDATMLVLAVGERSTAGRISKMMKQTKPSDSALQIKLNRIAERIGKAALAVSFTVLVTLVVSFFIDFAKEGQKWDTSKHVSELMKHFITAVTVLIVAVPEGLPLAITIAMAYSVRLMLRDNNLVRHLDACETMGAATTICSDKTGTLTTNRMTVMRSWLGQQVHRARADTASIKKPLQAVLHASIALNTTARLQESTSGITDHIGNKTECALLAFSKQLGGDYELRREMLTPDQEARKKVSSFSSTRKRMSTLVPTGAETYRLYCKGAAELVLAQCSHVLSKEGRPEPLTKVQRREILDRIINAFAQDGLRTLALAIRDFDSEPEWSALSMDRVESGMTLVAIVGIEDPLRPEVPAAIRRCSEAGIIVRMVTGDNIETARSISLKCRIINGKEGKLAVMEGPEFRQRVLRDDGMVDQEAFDEIWPQLRVLARSSPTDKYTLVTALKATALHGMQQIVAVTGDGTNDGPALKQADVGFAMGVTGTAIAKEASDIILMDDNFESIVKAVKWGRNVYDNVCKFLQFQLTVNVVAVSLCVVGAVVPPHRPPLGTVQMLWVNLIMDSLASLALATELPNDALLRRRPYPKSKPLVSPLMLRFIFGHAVYQLTVLYFLVFLGDELLGLNTDDEKDQTRLDTIVFNSFVMMQVFNEINARKLNNELNVLSGLASNRIFLSVIVVTIFVQFLMVHFGGNAIKVTAIGVSDWLLCVACGLGELPWGAVLHYAVPKGLLEHSQNQVSDEFEFDQGFDAETATIWTGTDDNGPRQAPKEVIKQGWNETSWALPLDIHGGRDVVIPMSRAVGENVKYVPEDSDSD